jgi:hypothetical protein
MTDIATQNHDFGEIDLDHGALVHHQHISDEYLWEFLQPEEYLENIFGLAAINRFLARGGGFRITDMPNPIPRFHDITVWAYHRDERELTWIMLQKR